MVGTSVITYYCMINHNGILPYKPFTRFQARAAVLCIILLGDTVLSNVAKLLGPKVIKPINTEKKIQ